MMVMDDAAFVKIAKALADPTRARMLHELRARGEMTCSAVCECFAKSQPTMSHHIGALAEAGVIVCAKRGQFHVLTVDEGVMKAFAEMAGGKVKRKAGESVGGNAAKRDKKDLTT